MASRITVIGAGIFGLSCAWELTRRGASVRVIEAARQHGYAPNQAAKRLATGRAMSVGHVVPLAAYQYINPHFADFISGAGEVYSAAGYDMVLSVVPAEVEDAHSEEDIRQW